MTNLPLDQKLAFDTELSVSAPFTGVAQLLGVLANEPVIMFIQNQSSVSAFFADNAGATKGMTLVAGESIVLDCRSNAARAVNMGFPMGTALYVTGTAGTGAFKVAILYAY